MSTRPRVVTLAPTGGARWRVEMPGQLPVITRTLATARTMVGRRIGSGFDLQVRLGGVEDLCADAVDLGSRSDAATVEAIRLRRRAALALTAAGIRRTDVAYLMGIPSGGIAHLLAVPVDTEWMTTGHAPPTAFPRRPDEVAPTEGMREMTAVVATRDGNAWRVHLNAGSRSTRRTSLVHADKLARNLAGDTEVILCPQLPDELNETVRASDLASAASHDLQLQAYELRLDVACRLRACGIGVADIGELLTIHAHRVRLLLGRECFVKR